MADSKLTATSLKADPTRERLMARRAALLVASGENDEAICAKLNLARATLDVLKGSPLFGQVIERFNKEIEERGVKSVVDELMDDAPENLDFIKDVRRGTFTDTKDRMQLRLQAAMKLLDKAVPNAGDRAVNESAARVIIDGRMLGQVLRALKNADVLDVPAEVIETAIGLPAPIMPKSPEEFAASYKPEDE